MYAPRCSIFPERNFLTFSLATGGYGDKPIRWRYCVHWARVADAPQSGRDPELQGRQAIQYMAKLLGADIAQILKLVEEVEDPVVPGRGDGSGSNLGVQG